MAEERNAEDREVEQAAEEQAKRLEEAANPSGDFPAPEVGVTRLPEETAEEGSTQEANESVRDVVRALANPTPEEEQEGGGQQAAQEPAPSGSGSGSGSGSASASDEEPAPSPAPRRTARHADDDK